MFFSKTKHNALNTVGIQHIFIKLNTTICQPGLWLEIIQLQFQLASARKRVCWIIGQVSGNYRNGPSLRHG